MPMLSEAVDEHTIAARCVAIDVTHNYIIDDADAADIVKIEDVFLYDANRATHCCEWTPSFYLEYLYTNIEFSPRFYEDVETEEIGRRRDELYQKYAYEPTDNCYVHCHKINNAVDFGDYPYWPDDAGDELNSQRLENYEDTWDAIRESAAGNPPI